MYCGDGSGVTAFSVAARHRIGYEMLKINVNLQKIKGNLMWCFVLGSVFFQRFSTLMFQITEHNNSVEQ